MADSDRRDMVARNFDSRGNVRSFIVKDVDTSGTYDMIDGIETPTPVRPAGEALRNTTLVTGDYINRARAFNAKVMPLSMVLGILAVVIVSTVRDEMTLAVVNIAFFAIFAATWLVAFIVDSVFSAEGVDAYEALRMWRFADKEQEFRHGVYNQLMAEKMRRIRKDEDSND